MAPRIEADFFNPPIRQLPLEYVRDWFDAAYDSSAGVAKSTWAYLLPRLLEILAAGEDVSPIGLEVSLSRFGTGNPSNWSVKEWAVLDRFQQMYLEECIEGKGGALDDVLCMFRLAGWPLEDLLMQVVASAGEELAARLWTDWIAYCAPGRESIWQTSFWESVDSAKMLAFYTSDELYDKMAALALSDDTDRDVAAKATAVATLMRP